MAKRHKAREVVTNAAGFHNLPGKVLNLQSYQDRRTIWITPTLDFKLDAQVVFQSWNTLSKPMNTPLMQTAIGGGEVADSYNAAVDLVLKDTAWKFKYMLTVEVDNLPPSDGLIRLYENTDKYDVVGGLYWTKGEEGAPMIYGDPSNPDDFAPLYPKENAIIPCNALGMGFTLFKVDMFRHIDPPWFDTAPEYTQDIYFFKKAAKAGYKFACDTRVRVGHMDLTTRKIW